VVVKALGFAGISAKRGPSGPTKTPPKKVNLSERLANYAAIEKYRKRPLLVYATSTRPGVVAMMASDAVREFVDQIDRLPNISREVDVLIHSSGGDALTAWKLMSILRERFDDISVLVPFAAFSAATIFSLGADQIVMHPHASLGPIDPQISTQTSDGKTINFSYEDLGAFLRFLKLEANIETEEQVTEVVAKLFSTIDPIRVGAAKRASELSTSVGERLLLTHMKRWRDRGKAKKIAENLNKSFFAHGDAVSRPRAREFGLRIAPSDPQLEALIWGAYLGIESYMEIRRPFDYLQHFLSNPAGAQSLIPPAPINIPPGMPPQLVQQILQQAATQAVGHQPVLVDFNLVCALMESIRLASEVRAIGQVAVQRQPPSQFQVSVTFTSSRWDNVPIPPIATDNPPAGPAT
jgi:hypothetical protein